MNEDDIDLELEEFSGDLRRRNRRAIGLGAVVLVVLISSVFLGMLVVSAFVPM